MNEKVLNSYRAFDTKIITLVKDCLSTPNNPILKLLDLKHELEPDEKFELVYKHNLYIQHRRLFMSGLNFLNTHIKFVEGYDKKKIIIYIGGCPGLELYELSKYYPSVIFIIICNDTFMTYNFNNMDVRQVEHGNGFNIHIVKNMDILPRLLLTNIQFIIIKKQCTLELLDEIKGLITDDIYLWYNEKNDNEQNIIKNILTSYDFIKQLQPLVSMVYFDVPKYDNNNKKIIKYINDLNVSDKLNMVNNYNNYKILYPKGKILLQAWNNENSSSSLMIIKNKNIYKLELYDVNKYDGLFRYYNLMERFIRKHNTESIYHQYGYCECNDCAIELNILKTYITVNNIYLNKTFINKNNIELLGILSHRLNFIFGTDIRDLVVDRL